MKIKLTNNINLSVRWKYGELKNKYNCAFPDDIIKSKTPNISYCSISYIDYSVHNPKYELLSYGYAQCFNENGVYFDIFNKKIGRKLSFSRAVSCIDAELWNNFILYNIEFSTFTDKTIRSLLWNNYLQEFGPKIPEIKTIILF